MNRYVPHIYIIPEDDCDRQLANGFVKHDQVKDTRVKVMPPAGGWSFVLKIFEQEYVDMLRKDKHGQEGYVVMLVDFDGNYVARRKDFEDSIPEDLKPRVFVVGAKETPETLRQELGKSFEQIGMQLADECFPEIFPCGTTIILRIMLQTEREWQASSGQSFFPNSATLGVRPERLERSFVGRASARRAISDGLKPGPKWLDVPGMTLNLINDQREHGVEVFVTPQTSR